jgi:hypothetical protein
MNIMNVVNRNDNHVNITLVINLSISDIIIISGIYTYNSVALILRT